VVRGSGLAAGGLRLGYDHRECGDRNAVLPDRVRRNLARGRCDDDGCWCGPGWIRRRSFMIGVGAEPST